ncbi:MAG: TlpA family protein disulfide reductase [Bacteroidales bacterium]|nr:TlpA family protein disulfide reductase [Bacteroidales bacterium]
MRYSAFIFILIIIHSLFANAQKVYDFQLKNPNGKTERFSDYTGEKFTVIDFWATWCKPCVNSIPKLVELSEKYDKEEVAFIGISVDSPRNISKVKPFTKSVGINYPILLDTKQEIMGELNVVAVPTLLIINSNKEIVYIHEGFAPGDEDVIEQEIKQLLTVYE